MSASTSSSPFSSGVKRARPSVSVSGPQDSCQDLPELPRINGEIILDVFTHHSILPSSSGEPSHTYSVDRLVELGAKVLRTAVTQVLFTRKPFLSHWDIVKRRDIILSHPNVESLITKYRLREKLRCHPHAVASLHAPEEAYRLFNSYFGAVYVEDGFQAICQWMQNLLDLGLVEEDQSTQHSPLCPDETPPVKRAKVLGMSVNMPPRLQPRTRTPFSSPMPGSPVVPSPSTTNPLAPAQPLVPFLQSFNQAAQQRQVTIEYLSSPSDPSNSGQWTIICVANGIEVGTGYGNSKQEAKEDAARKAFHAMGWAPHG